MPLKIFREIVGAYKNSNAISLSTGSDQVCTYVHHVLACLCTTTSTVIFFSNVEQHRCLHQRSGVATMG